MRRALVSALCLTIAVSTLATCGRQTNRPDRGRPRITSTTINVAPEGNSGRWFVRPDNHTFAIHYYDTIAAELQIPNDAPGIPKFDQWTLDDLFSFLGFPNFPAQQPPCAQMGLATSPGEVVALRYFAPKISSVAATGHASELGWRQIIRLHARRGSAAQIRGVTAAFILLNYQQEVAEISTDPFSRQYLLYTQVMLVATPPAKRPGYWILFDQAGNRTASVRATFEGMDVARKGVPLYVPNACGQCHGGDQHFPHLNLLDIDHWRDRTANGDDFNLVQTASPAAILETGACATPISVARQFNSEIAAYNGRKDMKVNPFVLEAVTSWNKKYAKVDSLSMFDRSVGATNWDSNNENDRELLPLLTRYCSRCHGTIYFDIYNRSMMQKWAAGAVEQLVTDQMPMDRRLDRKMPKADQDRLIDLLTNMAAPSTTR